MIIEEINIDEFIRVWFKKDYSKLSQAQSEQAYCEYIDLSGLYESKQFQQLSYINYLSIRVASMSAFVVVQRQFAELFYEPYCEGFFIAEQYHYTIDWDNDINKFHKILDKIEKREHKYKTELKQQKYLFEQDKNKHKHEQKTAQQSRSDFIKNMNSLGKTFRIDRFKTMMDEYALMVKDTLEQQKTQENAAKLTRRKY